MHIFPCTVNPLQGTHDAWYIVAWCKSPSCSRHSDNKSWPFFFKKCISYPSLSPVGTAIMHRGVGHIPGACHTSKEGACHTSKEKCLFLVSSYQLSIAPLQRASGASLPSLLWSCAGLMQGTQLWEFTWVQRAAFHSPAAYPLVPCLVPSSTVSVSQQGKFPGHFKNFSVSHNPSE